MDRAGPWRRIWHVTLPGMASIIVLLLILRLGSVLSVGFEQILLQQPIYGNDAAQTLDTFVYFRGINGGDWGLATAAGLVKGVIGTRSCWVRTGSRSSSVERAFSRWPLAPPGRRNLVRSPKR